MKTWTHLSLVMLSLLFSHTVIAETIADKEQQAETEIAEKKVELKAALAAMLPSAMPQSLSIQSEPAESIANLPSPLLMDAEDKVVFSQVLYAHYVALTNGTLFAESELSWILEGVSVLDKNDNANLLALILTTAPSADTSLEQLRQAEKLAEACYSLQINGMTDVPTFKRTTVGKSIRRKRLALLKGANSNE